jgi:hypothetical protein
MLSHRYTTDTIRNLQNIKILVLCFILEFVHLFTYLYITSDPRAIKVAPTVELSKPANSIKFVHTNIIP